MIDVVSGKDLPRWGVARPLALGTRVRLKTRWRRGQFGVIEERLDDRIDGMARYGVRLDMTGEPAPPALVDARRHELRPRAHRRVG